MKSSSSSSSSRRSRAGFFSSSISSNSNSTSTITYTTSTTFQNEHSAPDRPHHVKATEIPNNKANSAEQGQPSTSPVPISVHHQESSSSAVKIQSAYRAYMVRTLVKKMSAVNSEANYWERLIQRQETVDAVRTSERERIKINESLMCLLLKLDSVPGVEQSVRELRRHLSRRIVGLQEILDAVSDTTIENWDGFLRDWDDVIASMEKDACEERGGGHEMERFCAEYLGFRCLQRFLRDQ